MNVFQFNFTTETILAGERHSSVRQFYPSLWLSDSYNSELKELISPQESHAMRRQRSKVLVPTGGGTCFQEDDPHCSDSLSLDCLAGQTAAKALIH